MKTTKINLKEALKTLGIEKYHDDIIKSNSHGELFHCIDYIILAQSAIANNLTKNIKDWFPKWFEHVVNYAKENWERP